MLRLAIRLSMEEAEVPLEQSQEHIQHHAEHHEEGKRWVLGVALSSAIFAALAAVASLQSGLPRGRGAHLPAPGQRPVGALPGEGDQGRGAQQRAGTMLAAIGKPAPASDKSVEKYAEEQKEIQVEAKKLEQERTVHLEHHEKLATAVTMFQICIAVSAISVLTGRRTFWFAEPGGRGGGGFLHGQRIVHPLIRPRHGLPSRPRRRSRA